jgi:hypothetical protein
MLNRRDLFGLMPVVLMPAVVSRTSALLAAQLPAVDGAFPSQPSTAVREMVIASHGNVARVKELVGRSPAFARAAFDWGYGDWEDALGAAAHVGNREIAEFLIANGARPTIFSAAMLGQLDAVKALIAASPGIEAIHGPHSITLLKHAAAGGPAAQPVVDYLKTLPAADKRPSTQPLTSDEIAAVCGTYTFGPDTADRFVVVASNAAMAANGWPMTMARGDYSPRGLAHLGDHAFYPAGAPAVRIRFAKESGELTVSVFDPGLIVTARKTA